MMHGRGFDLVELERRLANLIRVGTVEDADYTGAKVLVRCDDISTDWLPWMTRRAGADRDWWAPEIGEQVIVIAPSGLMGGAFVLPALYADAHPEPAASPDIHTIRYGNGDTVTHNRADGSWFVQCAGPVTVIAGGAVTVKAPSVTLDTPQTTCTGKLTVHGLLTWLAGMAGKKGKSSASAAEIEGDVRVLSGDVKADNISLKQHTHTEQGDGAETSAAH